MISRPPIVPKTLADAARVALSYMRPAHHFLSRVAPSAEQTGDLFVAITTLEKALRAEDITREEPIR